MIPVKNKYTKQIVYFWFFASAKFPGCFWYTKIQEAEGFELGKINDYEPINITWEKIKNDD